MSLVVTSTMVQGPYRMYPPLRTAYPEGDFVRYSTPEPISMN